MFKRFFKSILIINICLSNIISHGAISVSDGSAFVTKAEFSADLNNLSNRMAQLENSLDAKIDSLVSSYLSRNGIWNGSKQTILKDDIIDFWSNNDLTVANGAHWDWKSSLSIGSLTEGVIYNFRNKSCDFIMSCTKSGMLIGKVDIMTGYDIAKRMVPTSSGTDKRNYFYFENRNPGRDNPAFTNESYLTFYIGDNAMSSCLPVAMGTERYASDDGVSLRIMPTSMVFNPVFFVNENDKVTVTYRLAFAPQTNDSKVIWQGSGPLYVGSYLGVGIVFGDFYIY